QEGVVGSWRPLSVAGLALPDAKDVAGWIAEGGHQEVSFRIRRGDHGTAKGSDLLESILDALHIDVGAHAGLPGDAQVGYEVTDHMPGAVLEARVLAVPIHAPAEDALVEGGRLLRLLRGDAQIRDAGGPEDSRFPL